MKRSPNVTRPAVPIVALLPLMAACAHQPMASTAAEPGFWMGLLHGFIVPGSLLASFWNDVRIYAFPNNGAWYDFGFMLGGFTVSNLVMVFIVAVFSVQR